MSLIALLSLSSSRSPSSSPWSPSSPGRSSKFADFYQRIPFHTKTAQRKPNSGDGGGGAGALKPQQQLQLKVYGTNKKSRYRSLLTGFSVDVVERFDRLLAPHSIAASSTTSSNSTSHPVLLATSDGLCAPQSSLGLFMDSLHFLPQAAMASSWRHRKPTVLATSALNDNSTNSSAANPPVVRQIELVALPRRRSLSRAASPKSSKSTSTTTVVIPTRATRRRSSLSSSSRSPTSRHSKPSELRRATRANAQLSSALMNKKILLNEAPTTTIPTTSNSEISYEINEEELASRFYVELRSHDSHETTSNASGAFTPPKETKVVRFADEEDRTNQNDANQKREDEWRAKQLDLERQVAALMAENQAKTALIRYLMDENSRIVGDCECGHTVKATISVESPEDEEEIHHHSNNNSNSNCASSGRAQLEEDSGEQLATSNSISKTEPESPVSSPPASPSKAAVQVSSIEVQVAKRKLLETEPLVDQNQQNQIQTQNQKPAAHEMLFEGLVSEIEAEFSQLFTCESSA